jgi:hypothetical protein
MSRVRAALFVLALSRVAAGDEDGFEPDTTDDSDVAVQTGPELGVRSGYGVGSGRITTDSTIPEVIAGGIPIGFDLGYRFHERWFVGGYGEYLLGFPSSTLGEDCKDCTVSWLHLSLSVQYTVYAEEDRSLWVGLGFGRHWVNEALAEDVRIGDEPFRVEHPRTFSGPEYLHIDGGTTFRPASGIGVGPYLSLSFGSFDEGVERCNEPTLCAFARRDIDVRDSTLHLWFSSGVRVVVLP